MLIGSDDGRGEYSSTGSPQNISMPEKRGMDAPLSPAKVNILIVDDKPKNLAALAEILEDLGESIVRAASGAEALRFLLGNDAAIILLDIQMPDIDGYELAALIRSRARSQATPIIFVTAVNKDDEDIARGYRLGAVDYVFKPINPDVLKAKVSVFVDLHKKTEAIRNKAELERQLQTEALRARTEKLEAERALRRIEERQSLIIRSLPIALYTLAMNDGLAGPRFISENLAAAIGFEPDAFVDDPALWPSRISPSDLPRVIEKLASIAAAGAVSIEYRWRCADGSERIFLDQATVVRDEEGGAVRGIVGTCLDVTYRRQLEQQLHQAQKMEAVGQLTGGIAHDFNNMLSIIIWNLDLISRSLKGGGKDYDRAQHALGAALNCAELIRQLLTFAKHQPQRAQLVDLAELVPHLARLLVPVVGERIALEVNVEPEIWPIYADRAQTESSLVNLALNARDAMAEGGKLVISAANHPMNAESHELMPGDHVVISVADNGTGMSEDVMERAFEPFFTTKEAGKGSGLGLSMVYGFIKQIGGHVAIESQLGRGTTVRLCLPRGPAPEVRLEAETPASTETDQLTATILVVEDNASIRAMTATRLQELGARTIEAENAPAALRELESDMPIDILFTDVVMPGGMSGLELANRARQLRPGIKIILASGYAAIFPTTGGIAGELLQKPYRDEDLRAAVLRAIGAESRIDGAKGETG